MGGFRVVEQQNHHLPQSVLDDRQVTGKILSPRTRSITDKAMLLRIGNGYANPIEPL